MTQRAVDAALGLTAGTVAQLENGILLPPDVKLSNKLDAVFKCEPGTMWREIAPLRLRRFDPELAAWCLGEEARRSEHADLSSNERALVAEVRAFGGGDASAKLVTSLIRTARIGLAAASGTSVPPPASPAPSERVWTREHHASVWHMGVGTSAVMLCGKVISGSPFVSNEHPGAMSTCTECERRAAWAATWPV